MSPAVKRSSYSFHRPSTKHAASATIKTVRPLLLGRTSPHFCEIVLELFQYAAIHLVLAIPVSLKHAQILDEHLDQLRCGAGFAAKLAPPRSWSRCSSRIWACL